MGERRLLYIKLSLIIDAITYTRGCPGGKGWRSECVRVGCELGESEVNVWCVGLSKLGAGCVSECVGCVMCGVCECCVALSAKA